jgi:hypothetical protein
VFQNVFEYFWSVLGVLVFFDVLVFGGVLECFGGGGGVFGRSSVWGCFGGVLGVVLLFCGVLGVFLVFLGVFVGVIRDILVFILCFGFL